MDTIRNITGTVAEGKNFFGRTKEIERAIELLEDGNNLILAATRRVGKTSFARKLKEEMTKKGWKCFYIDLQKAALPEFIRIAFVFELMILLAACSKEPDIPAMTLILENNWGTPAVISLCGTGTVTIDWGDGSESEKKELSTSEFTSISHAYKKGLYTIKISGNHITHLNCSNNLLTDLDVSKNTALNYLDCSMNYLKNLNVSQNIELSELYFHHNQLTNLDVSKNRALSSLACTSNQLKSLDISRNRILTSLICNYNQLTSLDVSANTALVTLNCTSNKLLRLDVSNNLALKGLFCEVNLLTRLDVNKNIILTALFCGSNSLTGLDVSNNTSLISLTCCNNYLTGLDVSKNIALIELTCYNNNLSIEALNALFGSLHSITIMDVEKVVYIANNPGTDECDKNIAIANGWKVDFYPPRWY